MSCLLATCPQESSNLYLLPAVDMINHASDPSRRNAILSKVNQPMSKVVGGTAQALEWAFCVTAGESASLTGGGGQLQAADCAWHWLG